MKRLPAFELGDRLKNVCAGGVNRELQKDRCRKILACRMTLKGSTRGLRLGRRQAEDMNHIALEHAKMSF